MKPKVLKPDDREQSARFIEKAAKIKADDDKERFGKACRTIIRSKKPKG